MADFQQYHGKANNFWALVDQGLEEEMNLSANSRGFVEDRDGKPYIRWARVALFLGFLIGGSIAGAWIVSWLFRGPIPTFAIIMQSSVMVIYLIAQIELERQRVLTGKWTWRFSLAGILSMMFFVAIFFGVVGNELRKTQREFAEGKKVIASLQEVIGKGNAYAQSRNGRFTVQVARPDFNDDDLREVIRLTTQENGGSQELAVAMLIGTSVTEQGLRELRRCPKLSMMTISTGPLSDETIAALNECPELENIILVESNFTAEELAHLRSSLKRAKVNGLK